MAVQETLRAFRAEFVQAAQESPFIVFLCGPNVELTSPPAELRKAIKAKLEKENFEVVLGEDEGLDNPEIHKIGVNAQDNELEFIRSRCGAVVIVADSVGSFCEIALFSWHLSHKPGVIDNGSTDCVVLVDKQYEGKKSYFNKGPIAAVSAYGKVEFVDFKAYDCESLLERLKNRRGISTVDNKRGRPRKRRP